MIKLFFFNDTATTEIYTLSLHDALPIYPKNVGAGAYAWIRDFRANRADEQGRFPPECGLVISRHSTTREGRANRDRKSTRLNSSHGYISYAVFCLKKKNLV